MADKSETKAGLDDTHHAVAKEITERKGMEELLQGYQLLSQHARDIILFIRRSDGRILEANKAAVKAYGYRKEDLLFLNIRDLSEQSTKRLIELQMAVSERTGILFETVHQSSDGSKFPIEVSSNGMAFHGDYVLLSIIQDITERKKAENTIRESRFWLRESQRTARIGSYTLDIQANCWKSSDDLNEILGIDSTYKKDTKS